MNTYHYHPGTLPIIISIPHAGTYVPSDILRRFTPKVKQLPDTDWHLETLYKFAEKMGVHMLTATHSRYVIDLNRSPDDTILYPEQFNTTLCPTQLFDGSPIYIDQTPTAQEIQERIKLYWQPYHDKLNELIHAHNQVIIFDAHSIRSELPLLFEGALPDLNIGTANGTSASPILTENFLKTAKNSPYTVVCNERFKGGYITRHYGHPKDNQHTIQLELTQKLYMQEDYPYLINRQALHTLQHTLEALILSLINWLNLSEEHS